MELDLPLRFREAVLAILKRIAPEVDVWAFGSCVTGGAFEASDLDLVIRNPMDIQQETGKRWALREAFIDSHIPIRVDVLDWACVPDAFQKEIARAYVVLQTGTIASPRAGGASSDASGMDSHDH